MARTATCFIVLFGKRNHPDWARGACLEQTPLAAPLAVIHGTLLSAPLAARGLPFCKDPDTVTVAAVVAVAVALRANLGGLSTGSGGGPGSDDHHATGSSLWIAPFPSPSSAGARPLLTR